ncbi:hypothetical protein NDU88_004555 [Pleurodeles waltl]|uniref:Uncharacterized protein n=1 Tax=Pleurodeles waltl TaxID=8319 RepID=A0AAV7NJT6_PLEWA|nr:hypothetical protein NDU88_004555 [Pleurodeles waltl]
MAMTLRPGSSNAGPEEGRKGGVSGTRGARQGGRGEQHPWSAGSIRTERKRRGGVQQRNEVRSGPGRRSKKLRHASGEAWHGQKVLLRLQYVTFTKSFFAFAGLVQSM